jgi:hypothetical protein
MVNFQFNSTSLVGILLMVAGAGLYLLRSVRPELARDHDIFFSAIGLVCGLIFVFQAWRFDPIMQFGQILLAVTAGFFGFDSIRMRGIATEQAKRNTKIVEEDRPVSQTYYTDDAELEDDYDRRDYTYNPRQIGGSSDRRGNRRTAALDYEDDRPRSSRSRDNRLGPGNSRKSRRSSSSESQADLWGGDRQDDWGRSTKTRDDWGENRDRPRESDSSNGDTRERKRPRPRPNNPSNGYETSSETPTRSRRNRKRPNSDIDATSEREEDTKPSDYVNYQPIDPKETDKDDYSEY